tara:strand:- start:347 stop:637 length:291 start_codon:yes stop_codon:yes gene_type:complete
MIDNRIEVEGAKTDDVVYGDKGQILKPIQPRNLKEARQVEEMQDKYPHLDYLMCLLLLQASPEELETITKNPIKRKMDSSQIVKQDFYGDNTLVNN